MIVNSLKCLFVLTAVLAAGQDAGGPKQIPLWPQAAPGEKGDIGVEADTTKPNGDLVAGRRVIRLGNVSVPTLAVYQPDQAKKTGAAVVVFPGGGYTILAMDLEGTEVCEWLNSIGVTGVLVKYRVPARKGMPRYAAPLQDAQRALGLVRTHAAEWGIDPHRVGVLGFSAGAGVGSSDSIRVNAVAPGLIDTPMTAPMKAFDGMVEAELRKVAIRRMGNVDEVAAAVLFLASDASAYTTGSVLAVDGGYLAL